MIRIGRVKLRHRPYLLPRVYVGDRAACERRRPAASLFAQARPVSM